MNKNIDAQLLERILQIGKHIQMRTPENSSEEVMETCRVLDRALVFHTLALDERIKDASSLLAQAPFCSCPEEYLELRQIYETYFGMTETLDSRFDIDYLVSIPLMVLIGCMPAIRRADYLNEIGIKTSVTALPNSIVVPVIMPGSKEVFASDIKNWRSRDAAKIMAPYASSTLREVSQGLYEPMEFFDSVMTNTPLPPFIRNTMTPQYDKPEFRYFDNMSGAPEVFHGYATTYIR
jgi:hypothetical protein